jgi:hypothetical protein
MIKTNRKVLEVLRVHTSYRRIGFLFRTPIFWLLSIGGNLFMFMGAYTLRWLERDVNPATANLLDCFNWAVGIVTTVGASPITPITTSGKVLMIFMMIGGAVFLWSYMALFIGALVGPELKEIESDVNQLQVDNKKEQELLEKLKTIVSEWDQSKKKT